MRNFITIIELMERAMRAPDFNQWFEGSVVVDDQGQPLRCYHGSFSAFDEFFVGSHFGDVEAANQRLDNVRGDGAPRYAANFGVVYPVFLSIKNPLRIEDDGGLADGYNLLDAAQDAGAVSDEEKGEIKSEPFAAAIKIRRALFQLLTAKGYDGMVYRNTVEGNADSYIIFRADQVRPATI